MLASDQPQTVDCIYIDPPYNNQESYTHYDDALSHDDWMATIRPRVALLWPLLRPGGSLWISIDDRELHYLKVALDHICGRQSYVATIVWEHRLSRENRRVFSYNHEYILVYAKDPKRFHARRNALPMSEDVLQRYKNPDNDPRGSWQSVSLNVQAGHGTASQFYELVAPNGVRHVPPRGRCWSLSRDRMLEEIARNNVWFGPNGTGVPRLKSFLGSSPGLTPETIWPACEVGTTSGAKKHLKTLLPRYRQFDTPKPESLIARIMQIATNEGDVVLDAYLGSGTTAAVALKLGRRFIGIERSHGAASFAAARLRRVVDGEPGGVSQTTGWSGGGGFRYLTFAKR